MPDRVLSMRVVARDDASKVFKEVKSGVASVDAAVIQGNQAVATSAVAAERAVTGTAAAATKAVPGINTMRSALGSLAFASVGLPGSLGAVTGALGMLAFGSLATAGIFLGLAGIATAIKLIGTESREAKERLEELLKADPLGRMAAIKTAMEQGERGALRERLRAELAAAPGMIVASAGTEGEEVRMRVNPRIVELERDIVALDQVIRDVSTDLENDAGAAAKKAAEELARAAKEAGQAAKEAREAREDAQEEARAARVDARAYFEEQRKLREEELRIRLDANRELRGVLFGVPGSTGVASARAAQSLFGGGAPELTLGMGRPGGPGALAGARKTLTGDLGRIQNETFDAIAESARGVAEKMESTFEDASKAVGLGAEKLVGTLAIAANALAGLITGRQSPLGAAGGITGGLSALFQGASGAVGAAALPLGIASIGLSFLDALTSSSAKEAAAEAHLEALRRHDQERPPANIYLSIPGADPTSREYQRLVDQTRREAEASGYRVTVVR